MWKVEGVTQQTTSNVASTTDTFDLSTSNYGDRGDEVTVTVTANDGIAHQHADRLEHRLPPPWRTRHRWWTR